MIDRTGRTDPTEGTHATEPRDPLQIVVVGAGIAGLATAYYLEREAAARGVALTCTVLDKSGRPGGKVLTATVESDAGTFVVEGGPDSFLAVQKPWAVQLAGELGLTGSLLGTNDANRRVYVLSRGRPVPMPEGVFMLAPTKLAPFLLSPLISPWGKLRMGLDLVIPRRKGDDDETLGDFVRRRFGAEALDKIAEPLLSGIYSAEVDRQSLLATFPRFREMEKQYGSLIRAMRAGRKAARRGATGAGAQPAGTIAPEGTVAPAAAAQPAAAVAAETRRALPAGEPLAAPAPPKSMFVSFRRGTYEIIEGLLRTLRSEVRLDREVVAITPDGRGGYLLQLEADGASSARVGEGASARGAEVGASPPGAGGATRPAGAETIRADAVVLATPAFTAAELAGPLAPAAAHELRAIRYVGTGTISLAYREDASWVSILQRLRGFGIVVPAGEKRPLNAITLSSVKFTDRAPKGHVLLRVFFGGSRSPQSMGLNDGELLEMATRELRSIMGITEPPLFHRIHRWEEGNPQYDVGHLERVAVIERSLPANLWVTGSAYRGIGLPDCVRQAGETAGRVLDELSR